MAKRRTALSRTTCPICAKTWPGHKLAADSGECPDCLRRKKADPEPWKAKFAPGRRGPLATDDPPESEDAE